MPTRPATDATLTMLPCDRRRRRQTALVIRYPSTLTVEPSKIPGGCLFERANEADAGVVDGNVDVRQGVHRQVHRGLVGDVQAAYGCAGKTTRNRVRPVAIDIHDRHRGAGLGQRTARGLANSAGAAGDNRLQPVETKWHFHSLGATPLP